MRVMLDTNILISALHYPSSATSAFLEALAGQVQVVLCDYVTDELLRISKRKFSDKAYIVAAFLAEFPHELVETVAPSADSSHHIMRDPKDEPILATAIAEKIDVLVSGDKDFLALDIKSPRIMNMAEFTVEYS